MMGTKKVGTFSSPRKKATIIITQKMEKASKFLKKLKKIFSAGKSS